MSHQVAWWGFVSCHRWGPRWETSDSLSVTQPWRKVIQTFFGRPRRRRRLQFCSGSYILYESVIAETRRVHGGHIRASVSLPDIAHKTKKKTTLFKTAPDRITTALCNELFYWLAAVVYSLNGLAVSQLCENVMGINLIGLLSGVIAVCGSREHPGNDAHTHTHTHPSALQSPSTSGSMGNYWDSADSGCTKRWKHTDNALHTHAHSWHEHKHGQILFESSGQTLKEMLFVLPATDQRWNRFWKANRLGNKVNGRTVQWWQLFLGISVKKSCDLMVDWQSYTQIQNGKDFIEIFIDILKHKKYSWTGFWGGEGGF